MDPDRKSIQRTDFGTSRRGYDREAVDSHLREVADAVEALKAGAGVRPSSTANVAAERVQAIVDAAEASAREIEARAHEEGRRVQAAAAEDVARAKEAAARVAERAAALERELESLIADLRAAAPVTSPEPAPPDAEPAVVEEVEEVEEVVADAEAPAPAAEAVADARKAGALEGRPNEGARLIALNMALSGTPREETARYLRENFDLAAPDELLDDVYAKAGR
jgi:DivIVA domain-containing protein